MNVKKFNDYEGFVDKFKIKKTTDDCYTLCSLSGCARLRKRNLQPAGRYARTPPVLSRRRL